MMLRILLLALTLFGFGTQALAAPSSNVLLRPIELDTGSGTLYGSLVLPKSDKPVPVVLIIAGSGPTDRDGNNPMGGRNDALKKTGLAPGPEQYRQRALRQARHSAKPARRA